MFHVLVFVTNIFLKRQYSNSNRNTLCNTFIIYLRKVYGNSAVYTSKAKTKTENLSKFVINQKAPRKKLCSRNDL